MTSNQIAHREQKTRSRMADTQQMDAETRRSELGRKERELSETKRSNRRREALDKQRNIIQGATNLAGSTIGAAGRVVSSMGRNHDEWYNLNPELVKNVGTIPYYYPIRDDKKLAREIGPIATIARLKYIPTLSIDAGGTIDPLNLASKNLYAYVRFHNSGARNYESTDLMQYMFLMESAMTVLGMSYRAYAALNYFNKYNWSFPKQNFEAIGFNWNSFSGNTANFRYLINRFAQQLGSFSIPSTLPIYQRRVWLSGSIFKDTNNVKSQHYAFTPMGIYTYKWEQAELEFMDFSDSITYQELEDVMNTLITSFLNIEDIGIMSGDILKAFGEEGVYKFESIDENTNLNILYDEETLMQIQGVTLLGDATNLGSLDPTPPTAPTIIQEGQTLKYKTGLYGNIGDIFFGAPGDHFPTSAINYNMILNSYRDEPTPFENFKATRFKWTGVPSHREADNTNKIWIVNTCGTEIVRNIVIYQMGKENNLKVRLPVLTPDDENPSVWSMNVIDILEYMELMQLVLQFNYFPNLPVIKSGQDLPDGYEIINNLQIENFTTISDIQLGNLHAVAVESLYGIPLIGNRPRNTRNRR